MDDYGFDDVTFIKIDVEGHELAVLAGAGKTLERNRPALQIELENRHAPGTLERTVSSLASYGYRCLFLDDGSFRPIEDFVLERDQDITNLSRNTSENTFIILCSFSAST